MYKASWPIGSDLLQFWLLLLRQRSKNRRTRKIELRSLLTDLQILAWYLNAMSTHQGLLVAGIGNGHGKLLAWR